MRLAVGEQIINYYDYKPNDALKILRFLLNFKAFCHLIF